jgi:hypothetical protein
MDGVHRTTLHCSVLVPNIPAFHEIKVVLVCGKVKTPTTGELRLC